MAYTNNNGGGRGRYGKGPRDNDKGGYAPRDNATGGYAPRDNAKGGYAPRDNAKGGYAPRDNAKGGYAPRDNAKGGYAPRDNAKGGYAPRDNAKGGYAPRDNAKGGYAPRDNGGYSPRNNDNAGAALRYNDAPRGRGGYAPRGDAGDSYAARRTYRPRADFNEAPVEEKRGMAEAQNAQREDELPYILMGRNAVKEAIKSGRSIDRLLVQKEPDGSLREIMGLARDRSIQIREVERAKLDEMCMPFGHGGKTGNHQGVVAQVPGVQYCELADILAAAKAKNEPPLILLLDGIEDPYNLGSILRSAECAGAHGVVIPKRRAVGVTAAACKASAGAVEYVKVAQVSNMSGVIARLKDEGFWIAGADMEGQPMYAADLKGPLALVIGSEGKGISKLVRDNCDFLLSIPMLGKISSLNASVAAAVLLYERVRQTRPAK